MISEDPLGSWKEKNKRKDISTTSRKTGKT